MKKTIAILALIIALFTAASALATDCKELDGDIIKIRPYSYGLNEVYVHADDGNVYVYYDDGEIFVGRVHLLIYGADEVIDVVNYAEIASPF